MKTSFLEWIKSMLLKEMSETEAEQILGVKRGDPNIKQAWRKLALQHHPDRGGDEAMMKKVNAARDVLINPNNRAQTPQNQDASQTRYRDTDPNARENARKENARKVSAMQRKVLQLVQSMDEETVFNILSNILNLVATTKGHEGYGGCNSPERLAKAKQYGKNNMGINIFTYWVALNGRSDEETYMQLINFMNEFVQKQNIK